ncbi:asparagine synthase (glutamine-hydrolyzing) [Thermaurantimonas aggregans]|uniref:asparagine synthase (glutamine-hydrolyzing) n=1 Tax=Thermaurantimonas aggregans TaxID=2173829 RepID=UPI0023F0243E|nr:asparagine synthase (glutamine-hydrolyzing) [Thermaurantimonas aggregans]MCX8148593.1 asparagine synthase (glutamine-hydrolyzing) [Thermaurantimonas aggregans]
MCGIVGFFNYNNDSEHFLVDLKKMGNSIAHRGPDAEGYFMDQYVAFLHRRLSIIDLDPRSNQPFVSKCGNYVLIFNGEIFNFRELKKELEKKGYSFSTLSDTEVLLNFLIENGVKKLHQLNGFFAFVFYDKPNKKIFLVKDRTGVKPLFYTVDNNVFYFASEPKAFFSIGLKKELDSYHLHEVFFYRFASGKNTIFKNIYRLLPGHFIEYSLTSNSFKEIRWFHLGKELKTPYQANPFSWFENTFHQSVSYRTIADVKLGMMLSAGLDSSSVLYSLKKQGHDITTFTISFPGFKSDEYSLAKKLSDDYGFKNEKVILTNDELVDYLKRSIYFMDEPLVHFQEPHLLKLSEIAKNSVKILLSGEGSDELLGGYVRYKLHYFRIWYYLSYFLKFIPDSSLKSDRLKKLKRYSSLRNESALLLMNANNIFLKDLEDLKVYGLNLLPEYRVKILEEAEKTYPTNKFRQLLYIDQHLYIPSLNDRNDRTTMGASIECREPFQDYNLLTGVAALPDKYFSVRGKGKLLLMKTIGRKLPEYIQKHRKIGLSIPWNSYIKEIPEFKEHLLTMHLSPIITDTFLNQLNVYENVQEYLKGDTSKDYLIVNLFMLTYWYNLIFN